MNSLWRAIIASALLVAVFPNGARADDVATSIPGTTWVGPSATSTVGGTVIDRVWQFEIETGRVAIIRVVGESGAQLGLYLFDGSARSLVDDDPIRSSSKEGGTQAVAASLTPGTYYVNVNGRNKDRSYRFTLSIGLYADPTPPTLSPSLVGGGTRVSGEQMEIRTMAADTLSGVAAVRFRLQGAEWSEWSDHVESFIAPIGSIPEGDLLVEVEAQNGVGLVSGVAPLRLFVDRSAPNATPIGAIVRGVTTSNRPSIGYTFDEPMRSITVADAIVVSDFSGRRIYGEVTYDPVDRVALFTPSVALELGRTYAVDMVGAEDLAGNPARSPGGWSFTYLARTKISATASASSVTYGGSVVLRGSTTGIPNGEQVVIERRIPGGEEWSVATTALVRNGAIYASITPDSASEVRVRFAGSGTLAPAASSTLKVLVKPDRKSTRLNSSH